MKKIKMGDCLKSNPEFGGTCCCNCANMLELHLHCNQVIKKPSDMSCICGIQVGWVCAGFGYEGQASLMKDNHGICEMHMKRTQEPK